MTTPAASTNEPRMGTPEGTLAWTRQVLIRGAVSMADDASHPQREPFLPGGLPLYGTFARYQGALYVCRLGDFPASGQCNDMVTLISGDGDKHGSEWRLAPHPWRTGCTELTRVIDRSQADEVFDCQSTAQWRGVELGGLLYLPSSRRISGYISRLQMSLP